MLLQADRSLLLIVDVQEKLVPAIHEQRRVVENCTWLIRVAREIGVPVRASEQYPKGLGPTVPELMELLQPSELMEKVHFSCSAEESCREAILETGRDQIIVAGVEAHVCVLQTVLDLVELGKSLFVVADAVSSRDPRNAELAVARMRQAGVQAVSCEMVLFEWAHKAGTDQFRRLSKTFLR
ncbi:MAG: hydrolase [Proteobacteria bacterium]|nr:MAG: hydrolase [Pseudomonadota bacterium]